MEINGIKIPSEKPALAGSYEDTGMACIILGSSRLLWEDYAQAIEFFDHEREYDLMAINFAAMHFKIAHVVHMCSVHSNIVGPIRKLRTWIDAGYIHTHSAEPADGVDLVWGNLTRSGGTSALFAAKIAMAMGYKKIIMCGCGLDRTGHFYDPVDPMTNHNKGFDEACRAPWKTFHKDNPEAKKRIRFMSGILKKTYGEPSREWINEGVLSGSR